MKDSIKLAITGIVVLMVFLGFAIFTKPMLEHTYSNGAHCYFSPNGTPIACAAKPVGVKADDTI